MFFNDLPWNVSDVDENVPLGRGVGEAIYGLGK